MAIFNEALAKHGLTFRRLPRGAILDTVERIGMKPTEDCVLRYLPDPFPKLPDEWYLGNYKIG